MKRLWLLLAFAWLVPVLGAQTYSEGQLLTQVPDRTASGTLGSLNAAVTVSVSGRSGVGVYIATTNLSATVTPECSPNGSVWFASSFVSIGGTVASTLVFSGGADSQFHGITLLPGCQSARARVSSYTSGTTTTARAVATDTSGLFVRAIPVGTFTVSGAVTQGTSPWVVSNGGTFAVQASQVGAWSIVDVLGTVSLPTGASTLAEQQNQTASLIAIENYTSSLPNIEASLSAIDDWDESDRAKVNPIVGQAGVQGNTGAVSATTQRVTLATDVALPTGTNSIGQVTANAGTNLNTSTLLTTTAHDAAFGTAGTADAQVRSIQGIASMTPVQVGDNGASLTVDGTVTVTDGAGALNVIVDSGTVTAVGAAADGAAVSGDPVRIAGKDGSGNTQDIITDASGELQVDVLTLPNVTIGTFPDNEPFNLAQVGGNTVNTGTGASGTGTQRVVTSTDSAIGAIVPGTGATNLGKAAGNAAGATDVGISPLFVDVFGNYTPVAAANGALTVIGAGGAALEVAASSVIPGTGANSLGKAEDATANSGDTGVAILTQRQDTLAASANDGDYQTLKTDTVGAAYVSPDRYLGAASSASNGFFTRQSEATSSTATWTSASGTTALDLDPTGYSLVWVGISCTGTVTGGLITFARNDSTVQNNAYGIRLGTAGNNADRTISDRTATLATGCTEQWLFHVAGTSNIFRVNLAVAITGAGSVAVRATPVNGDSPYTEAVMTSWLGSTAPTVGQKAMASSLPVVVASDQSALPVGNVATIGTSVTPGTAAANLGKAEDVAAGGGDTGISSLWERQDGTSTLQTTANAEYIRPAADGYGAPWARPGHPNAIRCTVTVSTATALTAVGGSCAAPGAGLSLYITDINFGASASGIAADAFSTLKYGTGGTCGTGTTVFWGAISAAANVTIDNRTVPIKIPANNEICWINSTAGSKFLVIGGFIAP